MEGSSGCKNLMLSTSQVPASAGGHLQSTNTSEAPVAASLRMPAVELPRVACAPPQHTADGWRWTTASVAALGNISARSGVNCGVAPVSPAQLSKANDGAPAQLLCSEHQGSTAAQIGGQRLQFSSNSSGTASSDEASLPHPTNAISGAQGSTVSPRDFMSSPPAGGGVGLPLWSVDTPTAAAVAVAGEGRGIPSFCRPLQSPSLCGVMSVQQLGGIPLLPTGGCELASPSMEGIHQHTNGASPDGDNTQKKFFFSAPFMTPPDPSGAAASGLARGFAAAPPAQSHSAAGPPIDAELAAVGRTGSRAVAAPAKMYGEKTANLVPAVPGNDIAAQDSLPLHLQTRPCTAADPALEGGATAAAEAAVAGETEGTAGGTAPPTDAAAAALRRARTLSARAAITTAAVAAAFNAATPRGGRVQRGVRAAAKSAVIRCTKRGGAGAAAVITAAAAKNSVFRSAVQKKDNAGAVAATVVASSRAVESLQQKVLPLQVPSAPAVPKDMHRPGANETAAFGACLQKSAAAETPPTKETAQTAGFSRSTSLADVASSTANSGGAAGAAAAPEGKEMSEAEARNSAGPGVLASELAQQQQKAPRSLQHMLLQKKKRNSARGVSSAAMATSTPAAASPLKKFATMKLYSRDGSGCYATTHRLHSRASHQYAKSRSRIVKRAASASPHRLQAVRRLRPHGGGVSRLSAAGLNVGAAGRNKSLGRRRRQLKGKKAVARGGCLQEIVSQLPSSSCNRLRRRRTSASAAAASAGEKDRSDPGAASADTCAAPLASALCAIGEDVGEAEEASAGPSRCCGAATAARATATIAPGSLSSTSLLHPEGNSSRRHWNRTGEAAATAGGTLCGPRRDAAPQQHAQQSFCRRSGAGCSSSQRGGTRGAAAATSPSCTGGATGSLSERVRAIVEKAMMSKHKIVWIERSEAKGFLPLPGMQEEKVYLVWTEKGIDVLVDLQAYIPWTHCPILMPAKHRRLHIPLLILSSTSLSLLFSHVCRRTATSVFRLPLTRTPPAYRRSMLQMLRGEKLEQRQEQEDDTPQQQTTWQQQQVTLQQQQQRQREELDDRERVMKSSGGSSYDSVRGEGAPSSVCNSGGARPEDTVAGVPQSISPCSTSAGSAEPSSLPSPPATDNADAAAASAAALRAACCVSAAGVALQTVASETAVKTTPKESQHLQSAEVQDQQESEYQKEHGQHIHCVADKEGCQANGSASGEAGRNGSCTAPAAVAALTKDTANLDAIAAPGYTADRNSTAPDTISTAEKREEPTKGDVEGGVSREDRVNLVDTEIKEVDTAAGATVDDTSAAAVAGRKDKEDSIGVEDLYKNVNLSARGSAVKTESSGKQRGVLQRAHEEGPATASAVVPSSKEDRSAAAGGRANASAGAGGPDGNKKKVVLDMRDFYSCSQGKVVGEDYVYFRQMLPDDEGADVYDINVSVKKRPKKTLFRKSRLSALWSMLAKRHQPLLQDKISAGPTEGQGQTDTAGGSTAIHSNECLSSCVTSEGLGNNVLSSTAEPSAGGAAAEARAVTAAGRGDATTATMQFTTEELLRLLAEPDEATDAPEGWVTAAASGDGGDDEDEKKQAWRGSKWAYVEEYGDEGVDERLDVPVVFFSEMRVLLGLAASPTPHRCNMSLASHRVSGAVQRRVRMFLCDGESRGQEIEVYAEGTPASTTPSDLSNEAVQEHTEESDTAGAGEGKPAAIRERQNRDRTGGRTRKSERDQTSEYDAETLNRKRHQKEKDRGRDIRMVSDEKVAACTVARELREKGAYGKDSAGIHASGQLGENVGQERQGSSLRSPAEGRGEGGGEGTDQHIRERECAEDEEALRDNVSVAEDGTLVEVEFPTEFVQYREADRIRLYGKAFLTRSLQILADVSGLCRGRQPLLDTRSITDILEVFMIIFNPASLADLSAVNLAQYAPNLFWNVVRFSSRREDLDEVLKELCPAVATLRRRRKRVDGGGETRARKVAREGGESGSLPSEARGPVISLIECANRTGGCGHKAANSPPESRGDSTKSMCSSTALAPAYGIRPISIGAGPLARQLQREERRQQELELRFQEMKIEFDERARRIVARKDALKNDIFSELKWSKKSRLPAVPENDDDALINAVIDPEEGILKWPLSAMTVRQKNVIYQACLKRDLTACICLTRVPGKGRAVFAADRIHKDDFVVEYKGELCSEREAREREQKYNRSKVPMGSFMFYFKNGSRTMAIDATDEKQDFGPARLINHSRRNPNMTPRAILLNESHGEPRLIFVARRNIEKGEELLVDYGERDPEVIREHPWLNN